MKSLLMFNDSSLKGNSEFIVNKYVDGKLMRVWNEEKYLIEIFFIKTTMKKDMDKGIRDVKYLFERSTKCPARHEVRISCRSLFLL